MYFSEPRAHAGSLFISSNILPPTNIICWKSIFYNVWRLLLECSVLHLWSLYQSWFKAQEWDQVFFVWKLLCQAWIKIKVLFPVLELNFGTQFQTNFVNSPKDLFAKSVATTVVNAPKIDSSLVNFCKTIFVTLACFFFVILIFPLNLFSWQLYNLHSFL